MQPRLRPGSEKNVVILFFPNPTPEDATQCRVPYALLYLERMLRDLHVEVVLLDEQKQPDYIPLLEAKRDRLLLAGVSSLTGEQISGGIAFSKRLRELCDAPVVWGGWHATLLPEETLREPFIDYVVIGQGERPLRHLVERLLAGSDPSDIPGLASKRGDGSMTINRPASVEGIDAFPPIDLGRLDLTEYLNTSRLPQRFIGYFATHGCPLDCSFCCIGEIYHRRWYHKAVAQIIEELRFLKEKIGVDSLLFEDDNFFVRAQFARELAQAMIHAKLELKWETSAHAHIFTTAYTDDDVRLFVESGCRQIYIGAESGDQEALDLLNKRATVEENLRFVEMLTRHGILPRFSTMVCLPTDSGRDFDLTIDMLRRAKLAHRSLRASIFLFTPYPGTRLYERAKRKGFVPPQRLEAWANHTLRRFKAPWAPRGIEWRLEYFANFYLPLVDPQFYRLVRSGKIRPIVFLVNKLFFPIAWLRFKTGYFGWPAEAFIFLGLLRLYNRATGNRFCLGNGSYVD
jgi:anaerobic magnesium-protoporphyrin IX monomethyl ester cyclase